jgi:transcriptional regulator with XRE-family HTH domain
VRLSFHETDIIVRGQGGCGASNLGPVRLGAEIRRRRQALGWSLEELSHRCGLSWRYLSSVEADKRDLSLSSIAAIAKALGADPGELLGVRALPAAGIEAGKLFVALPADAQEVVLRLMRLLGRRRR